MDSLSYLLSEFTVIEQVAYVLISSGLAIEYFVNVFKRRGTTFEKLVGLLYPVNITVGGLLWRAAEISLVEVPLVPISTFMVLVLTPAILLLFKIEYLRRVGVMH